MGRDGHLKLIIGEPLVMTNEYTLTVHGTVKVKAESFKDIKIDEVLRLLGNDGNLTIENVEKKEMP